MPRNYYIFNPGRLSRRENTIAFRRYKQISDDQVLADFEDAIETEPAFTEPDPDTRFEESGERKVIPIEDVDSLYVFGEADFNRKFFNYCGTNHIPVHIFNYYGFYSGTFYPREFLNSGELLVRQVLHQHDPPRRLTIARAFVTGSASNILRTLRYYDSRNKDCTPFIDPISKLAAQIDTAADINALMGIEGNIRQSYYRAWPLIIDREVDFTKRVKRPPDNEINALISFANSMVYTAVLGEIYKTQLNPLVSYLHEPGTKRFSLSLDLAEIFKPLLADRLIFRLLNKNQLSDNHFTRKGDICWLSDDGRKLFVKEFDALLSTTVKHRRLGRNISYRRLVRLECYKLIKHLLGQESYKPFVIWW